VRQQIQTVCFTAASSQASGGVFAGYTVLHHAVAGGNIEIVNTLLRTGHATPDTESSRNRITPLHVAAKHGRVVLLPVLMQAGYKAQAITSDGK
jgi:ankyrin repeat protein